MRIALIPVLVALCPLTSLAQIPSPDAPKRPKAEIVWDLRAAAGASAMNVRTTTSRGWTFAGTVGAAGGVIYRGRPSAGLSARAGLEISYPDVPSLLNFGFGFAIFPDPRGPAFIRATAGPAVMFGGSVDLGVGFEVDTQWRIGDKLGIAGGLGGFYKRRQDPFNETWIARATVGLSYGL